MEFLDETQTKLHYPQITNVTTTMFRYTIKGSVMVIDISTKNDVCIPPCRLKNTHRPWFHALQTRHKSSIKTSNG